MNALHETCLHATQLYACSTCAQSIWGHAAFHDKCLVPALSLALMLRGITCEKWISSDSFDGPNGSVSYNASFYFPVNQWQVGRQDYHRLLKEIRVSGTTDDGDSFEAFFVGPCLAMIASATMPKTAADAES